MIELGPLKHRRLINGGLEIYIVPFERSFYDRFLQDPERVPKRAHHFLEDAFLTLFPEACSYLEAHTEETLHFCVNKDSGEYVFCNDLGREPIQYLELLSLSWGPFEFENVYSNITPTMRSLVLGDVVHNIALSRIPAYSAGHAYAGRR